MSPVATSGDVDAPGGPAHRSLRPATRAAIVPTARAVQWSSVAVAATLVAAVAVHATVRASQTDVPVGGGVLHLAMIVLAAGASTVVDDPAEDTIAASPLDRPRRRSIRIAIAIAVWAVGWAATLGVVALAPGDLDHVGLTLSALGWTIAGLAVAARVGSTVVVPALFGALVAVHQLPERMRMVGDAGPPATAGLVGRWMLVTAIGALALALVSRDPATTSRIRRTPRLAPVEAASVIPGTSATSGRAAGDQRRRAGRPAGTPGTRRTR